MANKGAFTVQALADLVGSITFTLTDAGANEYTAPSAIAVTFTKNVITASPSGPITMFDQQVITITLDCINKPLSAASKNVNVVIASPAVVTTSAANLLWQPTSSSTAKTFTITGNSPSSIGSGTITFSINQYSTGYTAPASISVTVNPKNTWTISPSSVAVVNGGSAQTITITPSALPTANTVDVTLTSTNPKITFTPSVLTWGTTTSPTAQTVQVTTTDTAYSSNTVTLTLGGTGAAYQYQTPSTVTVYVDTAKAVTCTTVKTSLVVSFPYTMSCCINTVPCANCGTVTYSYTQATFTLSPVSVSYTSTSSACSTMTLVTLTPNTVNVSPYLLTFTTTSPLIPSVGTPLSLTITNKCTLSVSSVSATTTAVGVPISVGTIQPSCGPESSLILTIGSGTNMLSSMWSTPTVSFTWSSLSTTNVGSIVITPIEAVTGGQLSFALSGPSMNEYNLVSPLTFTFTANQITTSPSALGIFVNQVISVTVDCINKPPVTKTLTLQYSLSVVGLTVFGGAASPLVWTSTSPSTTQTITVTGSTAGAATLSFAVNDYTKGYLPPPSISVTVNALFTWALSASSVVITQNAPAQTITITPSSLPLYSKSITLTLTVIVGITVTYSSALTWTTGDVGALGKVVSFSTASISNVNTYTITLTPSGTGAYQYASTPTITVYVDVVKTVTCSIAKTSLVTGISFPLSCCMSPSLPCNGCGTATLAFAHTNMNAITSVTWNNADAPTVQNCRTTNLQGKSTYTSGFSAMTYTYNTNWISQVNALSFEIIPKCTIDVTPKTVSIDVATTAQLTATATCNPFSKVSATLTTSVGGPVASTWSASPSVFTWLVGDTSPYRQGPITLTALEEGSGTISFALSDSSSAEYMSVTSINVYFARNEFVAISPISIFVSQPFSFTIAVPRLPPPGRTLQLELLVNDVNAYASFSPQYLMWTSASSSLGQSITVTATKATPNTVLYLKYSVSNYAEGFNDPSFTQVTIKPNKGITVSPSMAPSLILTPNSGSQTITYQLQGGVETGTFTLNFAAIPGVTLNPTSLTWLANEAHPQVITVTATANVASSNTLTSTRTGSVYYQYVVPTVTTIIVDVDKTVTCSIPTQTTPKGTKTALVLNYVYSMECCISVLPQPNAGEATLTATLAGLTIANSLSWSSSTALCLTTQVTGTTLSTNSPMSFSTTLIAVKPVFSVSVVDKCTFSVSTSNINLKVGSSVVVTITPSCLPYAPYTLELVAGQSILATDYALEYSTGTTTLDWDTSMVSRTIKITALQYAAAGSTLAFQLGGASTNEFQLPDAIAVTFQRILMTAPPTIDIFYTQPYTYDVCVVTIPNVLSNEVARITLTSSSPSVATITPTTLEWASSDTALNRTITITTMSVGVTRITATVTGYIGGYTEPSVTVINVRTNIVITATTSTTPMVVFLGGIVVESITYTPATPPTGGSLVINMPSTLSGITFSPTTLTWTNGQNAPQVVNVTSTLDQSVVQSVSPTRAIGVGIVHYQFFNPGSVSVVSDTAKTVNCTTIKTSIVVNFAYDFKCCITPTVPTSDAGTSTLATTRSDLLFSDTFSWRASSDVCPSVSVTGTSIGAATTIQHTSTRLVHVVLPSLTVVAPCTFTLLVEPSTSTIEVGDTLVLNWLPSCRPYDQVVLTLLTGTLSSTMWSVSESNTWSNGDAELENHTMTVTSLMATIGSMQFAVDVSGTAKSEYSTPSTIPYVKFKKNEMTTNVTSITLYMNEPRSFSVHAHRLPLNSLTMSTLLTIQNEFVAKLSVATLSWTSTSDMAQSVDIITVAPGITTVKFGIGDYPEGYIAPADVTIEVLKLKTIVATLPRTPLVLFAGGGEETITLASPDSEFPDGGVTVVEMPTATSITDLVNFSVSSLLWVHNDSSPKQFNMSTTVQTIANLTILVTKSGNASYQFNPLASFQVKIDQPKNVSCTLSKTTLVVGVPYPMLCCINRFPSYGCGNAVANLSRESAVITPSVLTWTPLSNSTCYNTTIIPTAKVNTTVNASRLFQIVKSSLPYLSVVDNCSFIWTTPNVSLLTGLSVGVSVNVTIRPTCPAKGGVIVTGDGDGTGKYTWVWTTNAVGWYQSNESRNVTVFGFEESPQTNGYTNLTFSITGESAAEYNAIIPIKAVFVRNNVTVSNYSLRFYMLHSDSFNISIPVLPTGNRKLTITITSTTPSVAVSANATVTFNSTSSFYQTVVVQGLRDGTTTLNFTCDYVKGYVCPRPVNITILPLERVEFAFAHPSIVYVKDENAAKVFFKLTDTVSPVTITPTSSKPVVQFNPSSLTSPSAVFPLELKIKGVEPTDNITITYVITAPSYFNSTPIVVRGVNVSGLIPIVVDYAYDPDLTQTSYVGLINAYNFNLSVLRPPDIYRYLVVILNVSSGACLINGSSTLTFRWDMNTPTSEMNRKYLLYSTTSSQCKVEYSMTGNATSYDLRLNGTSFTRSFAPLEVFSISRSREYKGIFLGKENALDIQFDITRKSSKVKIVVTSDSKCVSLKPDVFLGDMVPLTVVATGLCLASAVTLNFTIAECPTYFSNSTLINITNFAVISKLSVSAEGCPSTIRLTAKKLFAVVLSSLPMNPNNVAGLSLTVSPVAYPEGSATFSPPNITWTSQSKFTTVTVTIFPQYEVPNATVYLALSGSSSTTYAVQKTCTNILFDVAPQPVTCPDLDNTTTQLFVGEPNSATFTLVFPSHPCALTEKVTVITSSPSPSGPNTKSMDLLNPGPKNGFAAKFNVTGFVGSTKATVNFAIPNKDGCLSMPVPGSMIFPTIPLYPIVFTGSSPTIYVSQSAWLPITINNPVPDGVVNITFADTNNKPPALEFSPTVLSFTSKNLSTALLKVRALRAVSSKTSRVVGTLQGSSNTKYEARLTMVVNILENKRVLSSNGTTYPMFTGQQNHIMCVLSAPPDPLGSVEIKLVVNDTRFMDVLEVSPASILLKPGMSPVLEFDIKAVKPMFTNASLILTFSGTSASEYLPDAFIRETFIVLQRNRFLVGNRDELTNEQFFGPDNKQVVVVLPSAPSRRGQLRILFRSNAPAYFNASFLPPSVTWSKDDGRNFSFIFSVGKLTDRDVTQTSFPVRVWADMVLLGDDFLNETLEILNVSLRPLITIRATQTTSGVFVGTSTKICFETKNPEFFGAGAITIQSKKKSSDAGVVSFDPVSLVYIPGIAYCTTMSVTTVTAAPIDVGFDVINPSLRMIDGTVKSLSFMLLPLVSFTLWQTTTNATMTSSSVITLYQSVKDSNKLQLHLSMSPTFYQYMNRDSLFVLTAQSTGLPGVTITPNSFVFKGNDVGLLLYLTIQGSKVGSGRLSFTVNSTNKEYDKGKVYSIAVKELRQVSFRGFNAVMMQGTSMTLTILPTAQPVDQLQLVATLCNGDTGLALTCDGGPCDFRWSPTSYTTPIVATLSATSAVYPLVCNVLFSVASDTSFEPTAFTRTVMYVPQGSVTSPDTSGERKETLASLRSRGITITLNAQWTKFLSNPAMNSIVAGTGPDGSTVMPPNPGVVLVYSADMGSSIVNQTWSVTVGSSGTSMTLTLPSVGSTLGKIYDTQRLEVYVYSKATTNSTFEIPQVFVVSLNPDVLELVDKSAVTAVTDAAGGAAALSGAANVGAATAMGKIKSILNSMQCPLKDNAWIDMKQDETDWQEDPFQTNFGSNDDMGKFASISVLNTTIIVIWAAVHTLLCVALYFIRRFGAYSDKSFKAAMAAGRFPSYLLFPALFFYQGGVSASMKVMLYSSVGTLRIGSFFAFSVYALVVPGVVYYVVRKNYFKAEYEETPKPRLWGLLGRGEWKPKGDPLFVAMFGMCFDGQRNNMHWYCLVDIAIVFCLGLTDSFEPLNRAQCQMRQSFQTLVFLVQFVLVAYYRPYNGSFDNGFFGTTAFAQATAAGLILGGQILNNQEYFGNTLTVYIMICNASVMTVKTAFDLLKLMLDVCPCCEKLEEIENGPSNLERNLTVKQNDEDENDDVVEQIEMVMVSKSNNGDNPLSSHSSGGGGGRDGNHHGPQRAVATRTTTRSNPLEKFKNETPAGYTINELQRDSLHYTAPTLPPIPAVFKRSLPTMHSVFSRNPEDGGDALPLPAPLPEPQRGGGGIMRLPPVLHRVSEQQESSVRKEPTLVLRVREPEVASGSAPPPPDFDSQFTNADLSHIL